MSDEAAKRYNVHFRMQGFMVLDYEATPEMGNIYPDEKHGYQMVIADITQSEARRVSKFLNEKEEKRSLMGWVDFLNDGKRDSVQTTLVGGE